MKNVEEIKEFLLDLGYDDAVVFENPAYERAFVGASSKGCAVYDFDLMCEQYAHENECSYNEARDFIEFDTIRALPYMGQFAPIVIFRE